MLLMIPQEGAAGSQGGSWLGVGARLGAWYMVPRPTLCRVRELHAQRIWELAWSLFLGSAGPLSEGHLESQCFWDWPCVAECPPWCLNPPQVAQDHQRRGGNHAVSCLDRAT